MRKKNGVLQNIKGDSNPANPKTHPAGLCLIIYVVPSSSHFFSLFRVMCYVVVGLKQPASIFAQGVFINRTPIWLLGLNLAHLLLWVCWKRDPQHLLALQLCGNLRMLLFLTGAPCNVSGFTSVSDYLNLKSAWNRHAGSHLFIPI